MMTPSLVLRTPLQRYAFSLCVTALALSATFLIHSQTGRGIFQLAVVAAMLSAWYGGLGPGLLSATLSTSAVSYFLLEPVYSLRVGNWEDVLQILIFTVAAGLMSILSEARYRAEVRLRERSEQLEAANRELKTFTYTVSHDLRWPLRAIDGYSRILADEYAPRLDEKALRYIRLVRENAQQMDRMVEDFLAFSRLGRKPLEVQRVDVDELVRTVAEDLRVQHNSRHAEFRIGAVPSCEGDPLLLREVFTNLLHNALKFTRERNPAVIEIGHADRQGRPAYFVKDNGVGFDMQYGDKLFVIFERLHRPEDYEGTGVGLAIVQRIIQRHGGEIWAEAEVDKGAVFYFTLPGVPHDTARTN